MHVESQSRGLGLGKELLNRLIVIAKQRNMHAMIGAIDSENRASIALHETCGFREVGKMPQIGKKNGKFLDLVLMQILLTD